MHTDVADLRDFYASGLGQVARRLIVHRLRRLWPDVGGMTVVGLGFAGPYLGVFRDECARMIAFMPAGQGVMHWPAEGPVASCLVDEAELPMGDGTIDRLLLTHSLEFAEDPRGVLHEAWRVVAPGGRLVVVVPNRRGLWARFEHTPFGHGRPYSRSQLSRLLRGAAFLPAAWEEALWVPPFRGRFLIRSAAAWERAGTLIPAMPPGVLLVEALKQVHAPIPAQPVRARRRLVPALSGDPVPARRLAHRDGL
ncbi:methyltransferase family protein [Tepidamorphus gemmatus]|uniref:Methyltransferase family protein n=1 Tax=Tepidamorphus gemmatus TaxID=747076 RepID=A0A4V2UZN1_9HYPH|nr:methyltransferase domain-containing protein [Tepidamorphus gemmatus]TCT11858.1 methyltransferase family protein [Tepidamorphus gemmatus]